MRLLNSLSHQCRLRCWALAALVAVAPLVGLLESAPLVHAAEAETTFDEDQPVPPQVEAGVDKALAWLAKSQQDDGSWQHGAGSSTAVPSLAVMAFLSRGHMPGQGPYGEIINKAIDYVLTSQQPDGMLSIGHGNAAMYEHGISTAMLSEAYGMIDDARKQKIEKAIAKAAQLILDAQRPGNRDKTMPHTGGWRYQPSVADSDISVTGWQLMALRGAANCGATVPKTALDEGREYVRRCAYKGAGGGFTYQAKQGPPNAARTGTGIVSLEMLGEHSTPEAIAGGDYLLTHIPESPQGQEFYYYAIYYDSQALHQLGGKYWQIGYPKLRDALLAGESKDGIWPVGNGQEQQAGDAYRTSMAVLALCVPYRYLPLYQK